MEAQTSTDINLHPPSSFQGSCRWEVPRDGDHGGSFERTSKRTNFKSLPEPAHNSTISGKNFIIAFTPFTWELREEVKKKEKMDHDTLSQSKGPAEGKEKMVDRSIMKFWLLRRTEGSNFWTENVYALNPLWAGLLLTKSPLNLPTVFSGKVSSIKCNFREIRGDWNKIAFWLCLSNYLFNL